MKRTIVVIGGGWAGCSAALSASKMGAEVTLIERTDMLLGTGLVGGIMRNNGRFTAAEALGRAGRVHVRREAGQTWIGGAVCPVVAGTVRL